MQVMMAKPEIMRVLNNLGYPGGGSKPPVTAGGLIETQGVTIDTLVEAGRAGLVMGFLPGDPPGPSSVVMGGFGPNHDVAWWMSLVSPPMSLRFLLTLKGYVRIGHPINRLLVGIQAVGGRRMLGQALAGQDSRDWEIAAGAVAFGLVTATVRRGWSRLGRRGYAAGTQLDADGFEGYVRVAGASEAMHAVELQLTKLGRGHLPIAG